MSYNESLALSMVKARLDYLQIKTPKDEYLEARIEAAAHRLAENGIHLIDRMDDTMLLVDMTVWEYQNRDKQTGMPEWLRLVRRERFLADRKIREGADG